MKYGLEQKYIINGGPTSLNEYVLERSVAVATRKSWSVGWWLDAIVLGFYIEITVKYKRIKLNLSLMLWYTKEYKSFKHIKHKLLIKLEIRRFNFQHV